MSQACRRGTLILAGVMPLAAAVALYLISREYYMHSLKSAIGMTLIMLCVVGIFVLVYGALVLVPFIKALFLPKTERDAVFESHGELLITATTLSKVLAIPAIILVVIAVSKLVTAGQMLFIVGSLFTIFIIPIVAILAVFSAALPVVGVVVFFLLFGITFVISLPAMLGQLERLLAKRCKIGEFLLSILFLCFPLADVIYLLITKIDNKRALKQGIIYIVCLIAMVLGTAGSIAAAVQCEKEYSIMNRHTRIQSESFYR